MKRNIEGDDVELKSVNLRCEGRCSARHVRVPQEEILRFEYHAMTLSDFEVEPEKKKRFFGDMPAPSHCSHFMPVIKNICTVNCISKCFYSKSKFSKYLTCKFPYLLSLPLTFQNTYRCDYYTCTIFKLCYNYKIIK